MRGMPVTQHKHILHILSFVVFTLSFYSCEFDSHDDNFVRLEKPVDEIQLGIDFAGVNPQDIVYVHNNSRLSYTLYTDNKEVLVRQFFLDGIPIETDEQTGFAFLNTNITDKEIHELKLAIGVRTGSESLAEYAGLEMYVGEFTFKVKFIPHSYSLNIRESTDSEGYLKLEWDKPADCEVAGYDVYKGETEYGELLASIDDPDKPYFVDTDYAYGYKHYAIVARIKNSIDLKIEDNIAVKYWNLTEDNFEVSRISANEMRVKFNNPNPFPCKYVLTRGYDEDIIIIENGINEMTVPTDDFPTWTNFDLYILPVTADVKRYREYPGINILFSDRSYDAISIAGDIRNKRILMLDFNSLTGFDFSSMEKIEVIKHDLDLHTGCQAQVSTDGEVAIDDRDGAIHIYSDHLLTNKMARLDRADYSSFPFHLISENKIVMEEPYGFKIYDFGTNKVVCSKEWQPSIANGRLAITTSISPDGKYAYARCLEYYSGTIVKEWTEVLGIDNGVITQLEKTEGEVDIQSVSFNPLKPTEVIIQYNPYKVNQFVIVDILTKKRKEIKGEFMNIDPFTGNLLYKSETYGKDHTVCVTDKTYAKNLIVLKLADRGGDARLYNNNLFFSGYYHNLSNLKEWNR